jgi:hypothetical protein
MSHVWKRLTDRRVRSDGDLASNWRLILLFGIAGLGLPPLAVRNWPQNPAVSVVVIFASLGCFVLLWLAVTKPSAPEQS